LSDRAGYIRETRERYDSYDSEEWIRAGFDEHTGGYMVFHIRHHFDPTIGIFGIPRGDYEKMASEVLVKYGMSVVLKSEISEYKTKIPDGLLNDVLFDIKGIEGKSNRTVKDKILEASKQGAETVVLYFHDENMFDIDFVREGCRKYFTNSKNKRIKMVYCIAGKYLYRI
jgi:hypothetical protein